VQVKQSHLRPKTPVIGSPEVNSADTAGTSISSVSLSTALRRFFLLAQM
jgi:hypothetical protein